MQVRQDDHCLVCGVHNPIGLRLRFQQDAVSQRAWTSVTIPKEFQGWQDVAHGGILATLLDEVCIYAGRNLAHELVTAELQVKYHRPVPVNQLLQLQARVVGRRRRLLEVEADLTLAGELMASASSKVMILPVSGATT